MGSIADLIKDLELFKADPFQLMRDDIDSIIGETLTLVVERTVYDTNSSREIILRAMAQEFGMNRYDILETPINYWGNSGGDTSYTVAEINTNELLSFQLVFDADGLANQEFNDVTGMNYPSDNEYLKAIRGDNFQPHHVTNTFDEVSSGNVEIVEQLIDAMLNKIVNRLAKGGL